MSKVGRLIDPKLAGEKNNCDGFDVSQPRTVGIHRSVGFRAPFCTSHLVGASKKESKTSPVNSTRPFEGHELAESHVRGCQNWGPFFGFWCRPVPPFKGDTNTCISFGQPPRMSTNHRASLKFPSGRAFPDQRSAVGVEQQPRRPRSGLLRDIFFPEN